MIIAEETNKSIAVYLTCKNIQPKISGFTFFGNLRKRTPPPILAWWV
jgi:hypothetical protein